MVSAFPAVIGMFFSEGARVSRYSAVADGGSGGSSVQPSFTVIFHSPEAKERTGWSLAWNPRQGFTPGGPCPYRALPSHGFIRPASAKKPIHRLHTDPHRSPEGRPYGVGVPSPGDGGSGGSSVQPSFTVISHSADLTPCPLRSLAPSATFAFNPLFIPRPKSSSLPKWLRFPQRAQPACSFPLQKFQRPEVPEAPPRECPIARRSLILVDDDRPTPGPHTPLCISSPDPGVLCGYSLLRLCLSRKNVAVHRFSHRG